MGKGGGGAGVGGGVGGYPREATPKTSVSTQTSQVGIVGSVPSVKHERGGRIVRATRQREMSGTVGEVTLLSLTTPVNFPVKPGL